MKFKFPLNERYWISNWIFLHLTATVATPNGDLNLKIIIKYDFTIIPAYDDVMTCIPMQIRRAGKNLNILNDCIPLKA